MTTAIDQDNVSADMVDDTRSLEETARFFAISVPTMKRWIADGCPIIEKGSNGQAYKFSLRAVAAWNDERERAAAAEQEAKAAATAQLQIELLGGETLAAPETVGLSPKQRADVIAAELNALKLARERGELVRFEDGRSYIARAGQQLAANLRGLPDQLATKFGWNEDVTAAVLEAVEVALGDFADDLDGLAAALTAGGAA